MHPLHIVYLNGPDIERLALGDAQILDAVEAGLLAQGRGQVVIEPPVYLVPENSAAGQFDILRGVVHPLGLAGVKVVGDFIGNHEFGLPSQIATLSLYDPATGVPLAILNATAITAMSTGAMTALGARYLANADSRVLAHVGARGSAYWNIRLLHHLFEFEEIRIHSKRPENSRSLAARLSREFGRPVAAVGSLEECVRGADIVVEAARLAQPEPLRLTDWIKRGALVVSCGTMSAMELSLNDIMHKVVVGDWGQCGPGLAQTLHAELGQIIAGSKPGRESRSETILFWHRGLSSSDIALGGFILDKAGAEGIGQTLRFE